MALAASSRSGRTVTVVCRLPSGLVLDLYDEDALKARASGAVPVMAPPVPSASVRLNGARHDPRFHARDNRMLGLGGRTEVDATFWESWSARNADFPPLRNGLVFAQPTAAAAGTALAERAAQPTGLEGLDPTALPGVAPLGQDEG